MNAQNRVLRVAGDGRCDLADVQTLFGRVVGDEQHDLALYTVTIRATDVS